MLTLDIQRDSDEDSPDDKRMRVVTERALKLAGADTREQEISLRLVGAEEMRELNARYRRRDRTTNVLSFPVNLPSGVEAPLLGDIVICAPVVAREAQEQNKSPAAHWEHLLVHGVLHLLGLDHERDADAAVMEDLERTILADLGWADPYAGPEIPEAPAVARS